MINTHEIEFQTHVLSPYEKIAIIIHITKLLYYIIYIIFLVNKPFSTPESSILKKGKMNFNTCFHVRQ